MVSQINITIAPKRRTAGINVLWFAVLKIILAMCGTASPINAIGPAKAVITPVKTLVIN